MAPPSLFSEGGTFFVSGKSGSDRGGTLLERERIAAFCREALGSGAYPLARFYPDVAGSAEQEPMPRA